ncbi:Eukaryotic translation initiation factor 2-alpha kinase,Eukaryotic translation initiation factor 2-alpha kinase 3 [Acanthosepion pharaonis]|uniref:non-specific serine/threonine protein kinase n=1 Tax=Acanthosepion pharaonis TaxID=158019 RepID=A0A812E2K6_ACAPH|nr:Eukaryotic translation initiation factor 2-alpha kinase,Eukaryotic translation initiation factor 2-alpha kinase 3 [Sepia pharaonis]
MISGQLRYACSMSGCQRFGHTDTMTEEEELIVITRNTQTVRAVDSRNGLEKWNFSVGNHEVNYVGAMPNKMMEPSDEDDVAVESEIEDDPYLSCPADIGEMKESSLKVIVPDGLVFYVNPDNPNHILWQQKLSSPVANAWLFHHNRLKPISLFSRVHIPTISGRINPVMYIGHHQNQMYVQVSSHVTNEIIDGSTLGKIPSVYWKPYLASSCSRTPTLRPNKNNGVPLIGRKTFKRKELQNTAVAVRQQSYPFDDGYYLFPDFTLMLPDKEKEVVEDYKGIFESSLLIWWKEVAFISIITAVVFNLAVFCFARFEASRREQSDNVQNNSNPPEQDEEKTEEVLLTNKMKDEVERPDSLPLNSPAEYVSKYYTDFEHLERLNHGAYGVVFVAKNKFDSCQYAVKRICLPKCTESEEKVMREVTTLANLDHVGIVRYFQSWFECPPLGWQEKIDREMGSSGCITPSVTTQNTSPTESPMQLCKRETLKDWLSEHTDKRNCEEVLDFFDQIVTAVEYVHKKGVLHRDLKPSNIFFSMEDVIKVGDFGLATAMTNFIEAGEESLIEGEESLLGSASGTQYKRHTGGVGTELYMSPELLDCKAYNQKVDIFSLGMILFELLYPFKTESERRMTLYKVKQQKYPKDFNQFIPDFFDKTIDLLNRLLSSDPDERPSASEILDSDLMTDFAHSKVPRRFRNRTFSSSSSGAQH